MGSLPGRLQVPLRWTKVAYVLFAERLPFCGRTCIAASRHSFVYAEVIELLVLLDSVRLKDAVSDVLNARLRSITRRCMASASPVNSCLRFRWTPTALRDSGPCCRAILWDALHPENLVDDLFVII